MRRRGLSRESKKDDERVRETEREREIKRERERDVARTQ